MSEPGGRAITVLAPGILGPWPEGLHREISVGLSTPAMSALFAGGYADLRLTGREAMGGTEDPWSLEALLLRILFPSWRPNDGEEPPYPYAAMSYAADVGAPPSGPVLRADPVHLQTDVGTAYLFSGSDIELGPDEAGALADELNAEAELTGVPLLTPTATRWYVETDALMAVDTSPPSLVAGREVGSHLPRGDAGRTWRQRFNELQMLLHRASVNDAREARGALPINSVWFWGHGELTDSPTTVFDAVWSRDVLVKGASTLGWIDRVYDDSPGGFCAERVSGHQLVVYSEGYASVLSNNVEGWRRAVETFERDWARPLLDGLMGGHLDEVHWHVGLQPQTGIARSIRPGIMRRLSARLSGKAAAQPLAAFLLPDDDAQGASS